MGLFLSCNKIENSSPPKNSSGIFTDISYFLLNKPPIPTLIKFTDENKRLDYSLRIMQRLGIKVEDYRILNIHKIGIDVPVKYVFDELLRWNGDSSCWPNHIAKVDMPNNNLNRIRIYLFGLSRYPFGYKKRFLWMKYVPLFHLSSVKIQSSPSPSDFDNARYLLYKCSGGYPVGVFAMYARSSIDELGEKNQTQLFLMVGFNFYGNEKLSNIGILNKTWELIHDRVTANMMNRFKQLCEWKFEKIMMD